MRICACDPDTDTPAFALFIDTGLLNWCLLRSKKRHWMHLLKVLLDEWMPDLLLIENQYIPPGQGREPSRVQSIFSLVAARGMIQGAFLLAGIPAVLIEPFSWQKSLGGSRLGRESLKRLSVIKASDIAGTPIENHNVADAINIGYYWVKERKEPPCTSTSTAIRLENIVGASRRKTAKSSPLP
jgi:hypothetical protein